MLAKFSICDLQETSVFIKQIYILVRLSYTFQEPLLLLLLLLMMLMIVILMVLCLV